MTTTKTLSACCKAYLSKCCNSECGLEPTDDTCYVMKPVCAECGEFCEKHEVSLYTQSQLDKAIKKAVEEQIVKDAEIAQATIEYKDSGLLIWGECSSEEILSQLNQPQQ